MADPAGDFARGIEGAWDAIGGRRRPRPRSVPDPRPEPPLVVDEAPPTVDGRDARIAELEAEVRDLKAALARILDESRRHLGP